MRARWTASAAAIAMLCSTAAPAAASDASVLQAKVRTALHSAKSFVETVITNPMLLAPAGGKIVFTVVAPNRYRQTATGFPGGDDDTIIIGNQIYGSRSDGWGVQTWSNYLVTGFEGEVFDVTIVSVGPDRTVDGANVGTYVMRDPGGVHSSETMTCTYQKATFRPVACSGKSGTITYARYDDPSIVLQAPPNAKRLDG